MGFINDKTTYTFSDRKYGIFYLLESMPLTTMTHCSNPAVIIGIPAISFNFMHLASFYAKVVLPVRRHAFIIISRRIAV